MSRKKLQKYLDEEEKRRKDSGGDNKKRGYNSGHGDPSQIEAEEIEAYRMSQRHWDDPMAKLN